MRKRRVGEVVCRCGAYSFPHRMMGGRCNGAAFVDRTFASHCFDRCTQCVQWEQREDGFACQALEGREKLVLCPELHGFIRDNEIRLYGENADAEIEDPKRRKPRRGGRGLGGRGRNRSTVSS